LSSRSQQFGIVISGFLIGISLFHGGSLFFARAQDATTLDSGATPPSEEELAKNQQCIDTLAPFLSTERQKFLAFIDTNFKNTAANSALTDLALAEYKNYRARLSQKFTETIGKPIANGETQIDVLNQYQLCQKKVETEFTLAEQALRSHVRATTGAKRTTAIVEKLSSLNGKLEGLNVALGQMRGYFQVMANKVPKFVQSCLKK
jgi:hypothetical protein